MASSAAAKSEDVLLLMRNVRHKKAEGELMLMSTRIAFGPSGRDKILVSHRYEDIKQQKISPDGKPKIQLQIVLHSGDATTFHFVNPGGADAQKADRDRVKEMLQHILPQFKKKLGRDMEIKQRILTENAKLFQLYKDLVTTNVISPEEFWSRIARDAFQEALNSDGLTSVRPTAGVDSPVASTSSAALGLGPSTSMGRQAVGVSGAFLADIKHDTVVGCNKVQYKITTDIIDAIFRTYPAVKRKHRELVPNQMTESEFWSTFFQSRYFHRDRDFGAESHSKDLFSDCARQDLERLNEKLKRGIRDPTVDVTMFDEDDYYHNRTTTDEEQRELSKKKGSISANQTLIKRCNHHSIMVLESCLGTDSVTPANQPSGLALLNGVESAFPSAVPSPATPGIINGSLQPNPQSAQNGFIDSNDEDQRDGEPERKKKKKKKKSKEKDKEREQNGVADPAKSAAALLKAARDEEMAQLEDDERRRVKRVRLTEETTYEDLESETHFDPAFGTVKTFPTPGPSSGPAGRGKTSTLTIANKERYLFGPTPHQSTVSTFGMNTCDSYLAKIFSGALHPTELVRQFSRRQAESLAPPAWNPKTGIPTVMSSKDAVKALSELSPGGEFMKGHSAGMSAVKLRDQIQTDFQLELRSLYQSCNELLRHFWSCFPVTNTGLDEKLTQMKSALERFQTAKLSPFLEKMQREHVQFQLVAHMQAQIKVAIGKYTSWQSKRGNANRK